MASGGAHDQQSWNTRVQPSEYTEVHQRWNNTDQISELKAMLAARDAQVAELQAENAELQAENAELKAEVANLNEQNEVLTEKLGQNSSNSHLPPSSDGPGVLSRKGKGKDEGKGKGKTKKSPSPRKRGGQEGHPGAHRHLQPSEQVDEFCSKCGAALPQLVDLDPRRYQMLDLLACKPHLTEFRRHEVQCPHCGHQTIAPYDAQLIPSSPFGPHLTSAVALLTGTYHLSRRRAQSLLRELFGIEISLGAISAMEARVSEALKPEAGGRTSPAAG
ncbi:MAG: DUF6444 domain-containing protein [Myxococcota bacterium]